MRCNSWRSYNVEGGSFWEDTNAIKSFAGDDFSMAKYHNFDAGYLVEKEASVCHYEASSLA